MLTLKTPWRDGATHLVMSPLEFIQQLAALAPRPRLHLIRFHGGLAPSSTTSAKMRALVVPQAPDDRTEAARHVRGELCAPQAGAAELDPAAQVQVIEKILTHQDHRPGRRRGCQPADRRCTPPDHADHPRSSGPAPGAAGPGCA